MFSSFSFYKRVLITLITKGFKDKPGVDEPLADNEFYYSTNRIYTKDKVKKMYFLSEMPRLIEANFLGNLKDLIAEKSDQLGHTYGINKGCELIDIVKSEPYELNFSTFKNRSRMMMWKRRYESAMKEHGHVSDLDALVESQDVLDTVDRNRWMIESWMFVKRSKDVEKRSFCKTNIILELVADGDDILEECEKVLKDYMITNDIRYSEVFIQSNEYNKAFSPVGNQDGNLLAKMNPPVILTDDIVSSFDSPTHGRVGDDTGIYFGNDIYTGLPIFHDLKKGSDAVNFLVTANTGKGKSNYMKGLYSYLDLNDINTITLDYEGDEYDPVGLLYDAAFIKVSGEGSRYFNTVAIGDLTGDSDIDVGLKMEAVGVTERVFSLLLDEEKGMTPYELSIFSDCINRVYDKFGVTSDPETWYLSKEATYFHLYGELVDMAKEDFYVSEYGQHMKDMVIKLRTYFEYDGINRSMFDNPITVDELKGNKHLIFSFGMNGVDESLINTKELALKQLFVGYITTLMSNYNKSRGKLTAILIEELQRYLMHQHSGSVVANMISGGRKRGMIVFLITNAPLQLMSSVTTDNEIRKYVEAILGNINGLIIGALKDDMSRQLAEYFSLEDALPSMYLINEEGDMKFSFLISYKDETTVVKYLFNSQLLKTPLYMTREDQDDSSEGELSGREIKSTVSKFVED